MIRQRSGVVLVFGGAGDPLRDYYLGGLQVALERWKRCGGSWPRSSAGMVSAS
jgi:hypothetical protein